MEVGVSHDVDLDDAAEGSKPYDGHQSRNDVVRAIKRALDNAGMEIPFPYQTLTFKGRCR